MKLELITRTDVSFVELVKDERDCLGITIKVTQGEAGPVIKKIKPRSTAERSLSIAEGDVVLFLNGRSTTCKRSKDIHRMLKDAGSYLDLQVQYALPEIRISRDGVYRRQLLTIVLQKENDSFGFILRKKGSEQRSFCVEYPVISNIREGSQAQKSGQLQEGDRLLEVDNLSLSCLSLAEIASILRNRNRAKFTFEYGIRAVTFNERIVESTESNCKLDLEIDVPVSDLGVSLNTDESAKIRIGSIRRGSIAERCGVLSEGDVILSINDIEAKSLTLAKADYLLRNAKQFRKISFITSKQRELNVAPSSEILSDMPMEEDLMTVYSSTPGAKTTWKHLNTTTPVSSNNAYVMHQKYQSVYNQNEDIKAVDKFQHAASNMIRLKRALSLLTREAYIRKRGSLNQNCTVCDRTQHSVKLCASCVGNINVECAQSLNSLRDIIAHFVDLTTNPKISYQSKMQEEPREDPFVHLSTRNLIRKLKEKLPRIFDNTTEVKESLKSLADKIERAENSCDTCNFDVKSVMVIVKKLLLLESLGDDSLETKRLLEDLKRRLLEAEFICDFSANGYMYIDAELEDGHLSISDNYSLDTISEGQTNSSNEEFHENSSEAPSYNVSSWVEGRFNITPYDTSTNCDYFKIAHVENLITAENSVSIPEINAYCESASENDATEEHESTISNTSLPSKYSKCLGIQKCKRIRKVNGLKLSQKVRRSFDSFLKPKNVASTQRAASVKYTSTPKNLSYDTDSDDASHEIICMPTTSNQNGASANYDDVELERNPRVSRRNSTTTSSSLRTNSESASLEEFQSVHSETMEVKMTNEGDGFGLGIILRITNDSHPVFIISAIKRKSPSHKIGILKEDDRIIAINHQRTSGLSVKEMNSLKMAAFSAETVTLTVEFDVVDKPKKFGTFDVYLSKTPKPGLLFREKKAGHPIIVSGVLKGGTAHRSGQIFQGDKISFSKLTKVEKFDPVTGIQSKEENIILTVQRDPPKVFHPQPVKATFASYFNPCFHCEDDVPRNGTNFIVKKVAVRAVRNVDALVLDQEVTLFRDPTLCDFGMLMGEDPDTGRAYVTDIRPDGPAHHSGVIKRFDRIVQVNGIRVDHNINDSILTLLSQADHKVDLLVRRMYREETTRL